MSVSGTAVQPKLTVLIFIDAWLGKSYSVLVRRTDRLCKEVPCLSVVIGISDIHHSALAGTELEGTGVEGVVADAVI